MTKAITPTTPNFMNCWMSFPIVFSLRPSIKKPRSQAGFSDSQVVPPTGIEPVFQP